MTTLVALKRCGGFGRPEHWVLPEGFSKRAASRDGLRSQCKECAAGHEKTPESRERRSKSGAKRRATPEGKLKQQAHHAVTNAVKRGDLDPASKLDCLHCDEPAQEWHHFAGYLEAQWFWLWPLCRSCHIAEHSKGKA